MDKLKILTGDELVAKGITKNDATLPEVGMKDVTPNGSWLEQKQIQSALEARKDLIEVERIEKHGTLSHAEWRDDMKLAEVIQQSSGYWQYVGHNVGKKIFLYPEEALYLMEVNCLQLKHNEVTVSLQKAYSLLLQNKICIVEYKVYAYLSRLGYKVFRHNMNIKNNNDKQNAAIENLTHIVGNSPKEEQVNTSECITETDSKITIEGNNSENKHTEKTKPDIIVNIPKTEDKDVDMAEINQNKNLKVSGILPQKSRVGTNENQSNSIEVDSPINNTDMSDDDTNNVSSVTKKRTNEVIDNTEQNIKRIKKDHDILNKDIKLDRLKKRQNMPCNGKSLHNFFKIIPDLFQKDTVTITVPDELHIPKNVFTNKLSYVLNLANIRAKTGGRKAMESPNYSMNDEVNTMNIRRIGSSSTNTPENISTPSPPAPPPQPRFNRIPRNNTQYRPFHFWKTRCSVESFQYNIFYQRPLLTNYFINQRFQPMMFRQVPHPNNVYFNQSAQYRQRPTRVKARDNVQRYHLECLKNLASRLKNLVAAGNTQIQNIQSLQKLLVTYNRRYGTRLRLTDQFDIKDDNIIETIELEDDDETIVNKQRAKIEEFSKNHILNKLKQLSLKLKKLEAIGKAVAPHRRAFSNVVKHYNKRYNADIHLSKDYEIIDRKQVTVDSSSSDSDCVMEEPPKAPKIYRNPFNVLREKLSVEESYSDNTSEAMTARYEELKKVFENWLPDANDFGRPEIHSNLVKTRLMEYYRDQYLYKFLQEQPRNYKNWLEAKMSLVKHMEDTAESYKNDPSTSMDNETADTSGISPIIKPEDCTDMPSMLKKLRIIETHKGDDGETSLTITFDVYNRDIQNFRKSNPPKPHFRVICLKESSSLPTGEDISGLHKKYDDNVTIVFAIVGSSSVSFLQINNFEVPVYVSSNDFS